MPVGSGIGSSIFCNGAICSATAQAVIVCAEDMAVTVGSCLDDNTGCSLST